MKQRIEWSAADTLPDRREVLRLQSIPDGVELPARVAAIVEAATAIYLENAEPRALVADISREAFAGIYRGEGLNAAASPIELVVSKAESLVLFVATVGGRITARTRGLFAENEPALAAMLDSVASAAADRLTDLLAARQERATGGVAAPGRLTLGYSPGYCGWHVTGQRALFSFLGADAIGVSLNDSCLMEPLKSVSGVLATGPAGIHSITPAYGFCRDCRSKPCLGRLELVRTSSAAG